MKAICSILSVVCGLCFALVASAQDKPRHPHGYNIFKPQIIMHFAENIDLDAEQREFVMSETEEMEKSVAVDKARLVAETKKFQRLLAKRITGEDEAAEQTERMLKAERKVKSAEFRLIVRLKNQLSEEQNRKLHELTREFDTRKLYPDPARQQRIRSKMAKLHVGMREMVDLGVSPEKIQQIIGRASRHFQVGLFSEGEKILELAAEALDDPF